MYENYPNTLVSDVCFIHYEAYIFRAATNISIFDQSFDQ